MTALYKTIYDSFRVSILNGTLDAGQRLPSSRTLAAELNVSRNTVLAAFAHLEAEGFTKSIHGSGMYVRNIPRTKFQLSVKKEKSNIIQENDFSVSFRAEADEKSFPFHEFSKITSRIYRESKFTADNSLEKQISSWLHIKRGVKADPEQIIITNGSQEALFLLAFYFLKEKRMEGVVMENPYYRGAENVFSKFTKRIQYIPVDERGMDLKQFPDCKNALVYITPSRQFPLGYTLSIERRLELLDRAKKQNLTVIEDDFDSDYRYSGEPISSLQGYDQNGNVIYTGTFTKVLYSGIRLGFCILPEKHLNSFLEIRSLLNQPPAPLVREVVAEFMRSGKFHRHIKKMHGLYRDRKEKMQLLVQDDLGKILDIRSCDSGLHMHAFFKKKTAKENLIHSFRKNKIEIYLLSDYFRGRCRKEGLVFGFAKFNDRQRIRAVRLLKKALIEAGL
ncbi:MAG: PLP-dependent aminotransferase family protein [Spirochaetia bacterium]|nr:PLP-dependent aminotransferase family protein [Spirochaetia bacterium]